MTLLAAFGYGGAAYGNHPHPGSAGTWAQAASMLSARSTHAAVTLANGKVLVVGGRISGGFVDTAELYDPLADLWTVAGTPGFGAWPTATLLADGRVLVAGGNHQSGPCPAANCVDDKAAIYDPATSTFAPAPSMRERRSGHKATLLADGSVLVTGGDPNELMVSATAELYHPATNSWEYTAPMAQARSFHTSTGLTSGKVLVAGGGGANVISGVATAELYDPVARSWSSVPDMAVGRYAATATLLRGGDVLVAGGADASGNAVASAERYDADDNSWGSGGAMTTARAFHAATRFTELTILVTGGTLGVSTNLAPLNSAELYDATTAISWASTASMASMRDARSMHISSLLPTGEVLVAGGTGAGGAAISTADRFHPEPDISPPLLDPGDTFTARATGLRSANAAYRLKMHSNRDRCHESANVLGGTANTDSVGNIAPVSRVIPTNTTTGRRYLCWVKVGDIADHGVPRAVTVF